MKAFLIGNARELGKSPSRGNDRAPMGELYSYGWEPPGVPLQTRATRRRKLARRVRGG